jgi:hypothetical protein
MNILPAMELGIVRSTYPMHPIPILARRQISIQFSAERHVVIVKEIVGGSSPVFVIYTNNNRITGK